MANNVIARNLVKYLGLMGTSAVHTGSLVPRAQTPNAEQMLWQEFQEAGKVADADIWTKFNTVMKRPTTFEAMLQLWDEMAGWDLLAAALVDIVDEATQVDINSPGTLWYQCNDKNFEEELNELLVELDVETIMPSQVYYLAALGNHFEKIEYAPKEGVLGLSFVHPFEIRRYWLERNRKCIGFRWTGHKPNKDDAFVMADNTTPVERVSITDGRNIEELYYPWDFLHFRRMFRLRISEHGEPVFAEAEGIYKKLRIAIDQMVVLRAQVQPDRYSINIDVQEQPPIEQMRTMQRWKQSLRSKLAFGQSGAPNQVNTPSDFLSYYNALALDTILYVARPKGFAHAVEKLQGTQNIPDIYDIELLTDLFYSIIGMPRSWFGGNSKDGGGEMPSGRALLAQDMRFLRKIKSIRRPIINCYQWLGYFHAVLRGKNIESLDIRALMPPVGGLEDQLKLELLEQQANVLNVLGDVMEKYNLPKEAWIETIFKRYMHLPDDVIHIFITALPKEMEAPEVKESKKPAPYTYKLIREIDDAMQKTPHSARLVQQLSECLKTTRTASVFPRKVSLKHIMLPPQPLIHENDLVISSYGKDPFDVKRLAGGKLGAAQRLNESQRNGSPSSTEIPAASEEPYYRRWIKPQAA